MSESKCWFKSKTLWFNAFMAAFGALEATAGLLQPHFEANVYAVGMVVLAVVNAVLRVLSTKEITLKNE